MTNKRNKRRSVLNVFCIVIIELYLCFRKVKRNVNYNEYNLSLMHEKGCGYWLINSSAKLEHLETIWPLSMIQMIHEEFVILHFVFVISAKGDITDRKIF